MALFTPEFGLMFWMLLSFLTLFAVLARFAWPIVIKSLEDRAELIENGVKYAQEAIERRNHAEAEAKELIAATHKQGLEIIRDAQRVTQQMLSDAHEQAEVEARKTLEAARLESEQIKREAETHIQKRVVLLSLDIAGKILRRNLTDEPAQSKLAETYIDELIK